MPPDRTPARWIWAAAVLAGAALRSVGLGSQIPVDDEWHALHRVVDSSYGEIALSFGFVDHCIPLTLLYKLAADTIGLGDVVFRAPSFLAGIALLIVAPWLLRARLTPWSQAGFAWLLALSPLLVFYSRFARPYSLAVLLAFCAVERAARIAKQPNARDGWRYGSMTALAIWVLPVTAPFVLAPALVWLAASPTHSLREWAARLRPLGWAALFAAPLVLPPLLAHPELVFGKLGVGASPPRPRSGVPRRSGSRPHSRSRCSRSPALRWGRGPWRDAPPCSPPARASPQGRSRSASLPPRQRMPGSASCSHAMRCRPCPSPA